MTLRRRLIFSLARNADLYLFGLSMVNIFHCSFRIDGDGSYLRLEEGEQIRIIDRLLFDFLTGTKPYASPPEKINCKEGTTYKFPKSLGFSVEGGDEFSACAELSADPRAEIVWQFVRSLRYARRKAARSLSGLRTLSIRVCDQTPAPG